MVIQVVSVYRSQDIYATDSFAFNGYVVDVEIRRYGLKSSFEQVSEFEFKPVLIPLVAQERVVWFYAYDVALVMDSK